MYNNTYINAINIHLQKSLSLDISDVNVMWTNFKQAVCYCLDSYVPQKIFKNTNRRPKWFCRNLRNLERKARRAFKVRKSTLGHSLHYQFLLKQLARDTRF